MSTSGAPPGWYADPAGSTGWRWWDGNSWTTYTAPHVGFTQQSTQPVYPPLQPPSLAGLIEAEERVSRWAALAAVLAAFGVMLNVFISLLEANAWRRYFHALHMFFQQIGAPGYVAPPQPHPPTAGYVTSLLLIPGIVFLVWQYRAATTARALGYPGRHDPGWGVGAWFVPIVNLWIPYGAMRDLLPPGHPMRRLGWLPWVLYLSSSFVAAAFVFLVAEHHAVAAVVGPVVISIQGLWARWAYNFVRAVSADHRSRVLQQTR